LIPEIRSIGQVNISLLPNGATFTLDLREAIEASKTIRPVAVIPMHHAEFDPNEFKNKLESESAINVALLQIGEAYDLN